MMDNSMIMATAKLAKDYGKRGPTNIEDTGWKGCSTFTFKHKLYYKQDFIFLKWSNEAPWFTVDFLVYCYGYFCLLAPI